MSCLSSYLRTKYQADLARVQAQLAEIDTAVTSAMTNGEVEEYRFNSGEGQQMTRRRSLKELLDVQEKLEAKEAKILRKLNGRGLVNMTMRRKGYGYNGRR